MFNATFTYLFNLFFVIILFTTACLGAEKLEEGVDIIALTERPYYIFEDATNKVGINDLLKYPKAFILANSLIPRNEHRNSAYWVKFEIIDSSSKYSEWFMEMYNYRIDSLEVFMVSNGKLLERKISGFSYPFNNKELPHKNFAFLLPKTDSGLLTIYIKVKSASRVDFYSVIKSAHYFLEYSYGEYITLGAMYGMLIIMILYNLFHLIILKDSLFFFYMNSIIGFLFHFLTKDGLGFQYVWFNYPDAQDHIYNFSVCFAMVNQLLFTWKFFEKQFFNKVYNILLWVLIFERIAYLLFVILSKSDSNLFLMADLPLLIFISWISSKNIQLSEVRTFFFPIGSLLFLTGYVFTSLFELGLVQFNHSLWIVYAYNLGLLAQIIAFWGCISFRERSLLLSKKNMDFELMIKNSELKLMEMHKIELENAITNTTKSLEKKNEIIKTTSKNMETFVYKTYHNLRGPLRTIMGLYNLSKTTDDPNLIKELFFHFNKSITDVDKELLVISKVADINIHEIKIEQVDLYEIVKKAFGDFPIQLYPNDPTQFKTDGDVWLLEEGIMHLKEIYEKLTTDKVEAPELFISLENEVYIFNIKFKSTTMKNFDVNNFFTPFNKNISYFYNLHFEPFLCQAIMDKIKGKIQMQKVEEDKIMITIYSK